MLLVPLWRLNIDRRSGSAGLSLIGDSRKGTDLTGRRARNNDNDDDNSGGIGVGDFQFG